MPYPETLVAFAILPGLPLLVLWIMMKRWLGKRQSTSRWPFPCQPRPAGWSLQQRTEDLMVDLVMNVMLLLMVGLMASGIAIHTGQWVVTGLTGALGSLFFAWRIAIGARNVVNYRLGLAGEQIVGTRLEELRASGCQVFHDLEVREKGRDPWNIDHIVVAPTGVYAIETKARRKSIQPTPDGQLGHKVIFDGRCLRYPRGTDTHGLEQAQRNADHLRELLRKQNTTDIPVFPVLVLPGWYVVVQKEGAVTVFNEKQVRHMGFKKPVALGPKLLAAVSAQIETLCQTEE